MNSEKVNSWLALGANVGVLIGLILLIVEIRQNTEMTRAQINQSRTDAAQSEQQATYNSDYLPAILVKRDKGEELTDEELRRYGAYIRSFNRNMDNQLWQYNQGLLGENIPRSIRGAVRIVIGSHDLSIRVWENQKFGFTDEYVDFVDNVLDDMGQDTLN